MLRRLLFLPLVLLFSGCGLFGQSRAGTHSFAPQYAGLAKKSVAILIYTPHAVSDEYPVVREELPSFIITAMHEHLPDTQVILNPTDLMYWQNATLNWHSLREKDIGRRFSVDRVLCIVLTDYSTRRTLSPSDLQGRIRAMCKIFEVETPGNEPAWSGPIEASWPPVKPLDPTQINEDAVRSQTLNAFAQELVRHYYQ